MSSSSSRGRHALGRVAEEAAGDYLVARGFVILGQNVRVGALEIDLVARAGNLLALVEVRARKARALVGALASIGPTKRARMLRAATRVLVDPPFPLDGITRVRLDVCVVHVSPRGVGVEHFPAAITAPEET